jgi:hypothetical protein
MYCAQAISKLTSQTTRVLAQSSSASSSMHYCAYDSPTHKHFSEEYFRYQLHALSKPDNRGKWLACLKSDIVPGIITSFYEVDRVKPPVTSNC